MKPERLSLTLTVNGQKQEAQVEPRLLLSDFLRHALGLTGTHVGCEHGVCGACTVWLDGQPVRACLMLAVQAQGTAITTIEGICPDTAELHPVQQALWQEHGLQCGFCTPGIVMTLIPFLHEHPDPGDADIRTALSAHLCRCTGYQQIVAAVQRAAADMQGRKAA